MASHIENATEARAGVTKRRKRSAATCLQINIWGEWHAARVNGKRGDTASNVRRRHIEVHIQAPWPQESWVYRLGPIGGSQQQYTYASGRKLMSHGKGLYI